MKSFVIRALSAVIAVIILVSLYHFFEKSGLKFFTLIGVIVGGYELLKLLFKSDVSRLNRFSFYIILLSVFLLSTIYPQYSGVVFSFFSICFCLIILSTHRKFEDLDKLTYLQAKGMLGFLYMGLLPSFPILILDGPHGLIWFLTLLSVVFAGDIGAYIAGVNLGEQKLMPIISPKKSIEGSMGGLICSGGMGLVMSQFLPHVPTSHILILSIFTAIAGQLGDLFESQLKRIAGVKDSGNIMPGHGGILDRIDGVLFAGPVIYIGTIFLESI